MSAGPKPAHPVTFYRFEPKVNAVTDNHGILSTLTNKINDLREISRSAGGRSVLRALTG
jgi:hypothetical protein